MQSWSLIFADAEDTSLRADFYPNEDSSLSVNIRSPTRGLANENGERTHARIVTWREYQGGFET